MRSFYQFSLATGLLSTLGIAKPGAIPACPANSPTAHTANGTVCGLSLPEYSQDAYLGIPFAEPPVGNLRFKLPVPYSKKYAAFDATHQPTSCVGYGPFSYHVPGLRGEDCLYLNVVRPHTEKTDLPVFVWIYGGGLSQGALADPIYNTSALVAKSIEMDKPTIFVNINYRLSGWGFLASEEVLDARAANAGLFDQRLALKWVNENIHAFGGDPSKVTIAGESAGAFSTGFHTIAFDGQNDGLFRAAIGQSGTAFNFPMATPEQIDAFGYQSLYEDVVEAAGCQNASDSLQCLRSAPFDLLNQTFPTQAWFPVVDGDFFARLPSDSFKLGKVAKVAALLGTNTDEGTLEGITPRGTLNNDTAVRQWIESANPLLSKQQITELMKLYPDDPARGCPFGTGDKRYPKAGLQFKRGAAIITDQDFTAGRRATTKYFASCPSEERMPLFSYRFDQRPWNGILTDIATHKPVGVTHAAEIGYVFNNTNPSSSNWIGPGSSYHQLSDLMSRSWIAFTHDLEPNNHGLDGVPHWPQYELDAPKNMVFRIESNDGGSYVEKDDWREEQLEWFNQNWKSLGI